MKDHVKVTAKEASQMILLFCSMAIMEETIEVPLKLGVFKHENKQFATRLQRFADKGQRDMWDTFEKVLSKNTLTELADTVDNLEKIMNQLMNASTVQVAIIADFFNKLQNGEINEINSQYDCTDVFVNFKWLDIKEALAYNMKWANPADFENFVLKNDNNDYKIVDIANGTLTIKPIKGLNAKPIDVPFLSIEKRALLSIQNHIYKTVNGRDYPAYGFIEIDGKTVELGRVNLMDYETPIIKWRYLTEKGYYEFGEAVVEMVPTKSIQTKGYRWSAIIAGIAITNTEIMTAKDYYKMIAEREIQASQIVTEVEFEPTPETGETQLQGTETGQGGNAEPKPAKAKRTPKKATDGEKKPKSKK